MENGLNNVDEKYINKYFPDRSIFRAYKKYLTKSIIAVMIIFTFFLAGSLAGLIWTGIMLFSHISSGEEGYMGIGIVILLFFLLIAAGCIALMMVVSKSARRSVEDWIKLTAENCGYSASEIREFEKQVMESSSLLVPTEALFAKTFKNGILTRDYIYFMGRQNILQVLKCSDIANAYLYMSSAPIIGGNKKTHSLNIDLIAKNGKIVGTEISQKVGNSLQKILKEKYPLIDTNDGKVMSEKEYGKWWDDFRKSFPMAGSTKK